MFSARSQKLPAPVSATTLKVGDVLLPQTRAHTGHAGVATRMASPSTRMKDTQSLVLRGDRSKPGRSLQGPWDDGPVAAPRQPHRDTGAGELEAAVFCADHR